MTLTLRASAVVVLVASVVALGGCGRKGPLEPPPGAPTEKVAKPDGKTEERPVKPHRPFVLDGLLN